jgi:CDP-glycerol glycerophosphotransferase (TagB/SpsB family)
MKLRRPSTPPVLQTLLRLLVTTTFWLPLYFASFVVPRKKDMWVFGGFGGRLYADNAKALFSWMLDNSHHQKSVYWITKRRDILGKLSEENKPCAHAYSIKGLYI